MNTNFTDPAKGLSRAVGAKSRTRRRALKNSTKLDAVAQAGRRNDILPKLKLEMRPIGSLRMSEHKVRSIDPDHVAEVAASFCRLGFAKPILITPDGEIIDGHVCLAAAQTLRLEELPCIVVEHLDETEVRLLRLAVNRLGEKGHWDLDALKVEFEGLLDLEAPIEITGFIGAEIDLVIVGDEADPDVKANAVTEPARDKPAITLLGDVWSCGEHSLICADAREIASYVRLFAALPPARIVLSDPPFGCRIEGLVSGNGAVKHKDFIDGSGDMSSEELATLLSASLQNAAKQTIAGGLMYLFMDYRELETLLRVARELGLALVNILVWDKGRGGMGGTYRNACEFIALFKSGKGAHLDRVNLGKNGRDRTTVLSYPGATTMGSSAQELLEEHPTPKSVELLADLLLDTTNVGEIVLDMFMGSGTTMIAAEKTKRVAVGLELDAHYCDVIVRRFEKFTGLKAVHAASGKTFDEIAELRAATNSTTGSESHQDDINVKADTVTPIASDAPVTATPDTEIGASHV
jgi:DNA modification methylase